MRRINLQLMKKILKKIFCLPPVPTLLAAIPSFALVIYVLANEIENTPIAYIAYTLSAYALVIAITGTRGVAAWLMGWFTGHPFVKKLLGISLVERFVRDTFFRTEFSIYQGLFINLLYAGIKMFSGIYYRSVWFITLSVYYILLAAMRLSLLLFVRKEEEKKDRISELRCYRLCGIFLLVMNQALAGIIILVVHQNSGFEYPGLLIYVMAMYTFYAVIIAVRNVVRFRKYGSPVMSAAKVISLTAALVSMLSLETAMLTQFGAADDAGFRQIMTSCTGGGVCLIVLGMAVYMIVRSTREMKKENDQELKRR